MEIIALCFLCLAFGLTIGFEWGCHWERKRDAAPVPMIPSDFDRTNYINQRPEPIRVYGTNLYRLH